MKKPKPPKDRAKKRRKYNLNSKIRSALRTLWMQSPIRREAIRSARVAPNTVSCAECGKRMKEKEKKEPGMEKAPRVQYQVDHTEPAAELASEITSWDDYIRRLLRPASPLRVLCKECHSVKTQAENKKRRSSKSSLS